ncbi:peroxiredoxin family protein [Longimicrobium sp.]|uniref:peroxiredoxin family protein n=1 Tax=Longimicrobium sp. TaxID=2029185 RepID=UPI003B3A1A37
MQDRFFRSLPYLALAAAAVLVVVLGQQKRSLIEEVQKTRSQLVEARTQPMRGMWMPAFQAPTIEGQPATIGEVPGEGRQVLLMYTTTCPYCLSSIPAWKQIKAVTDTMTSIRAAVYGVSLDSVDVTRQYIAKHALPYPTVRFPDEKVAGMYRAGTVPVTLVLDEQGRTIYSRTGELKNPAAIDSVMQAIRWRPAPPPAPGDSAAPAGAPAVTAPAAQGQARR